MKKVDVVALDWAKRLRWVLSHVLKGEQAGFPLYPLLRSCKEESEATTSLSLYHTWCAVHQQHAAALDRRGERFPSVMDFPYNGQQRWEKWFFVWTKYVWRRLNIRLEKKELNSLMIYQSELQHKSVTTFYWSVFKSSRQVWVTLLMMISHLTTYS